MNVKDTHDFTGRRRKWGRGRAPDVHDPYAAATKLKSPAHCTTCGVIYEHGRWAWPGPEKKTEGEEILCPACKRIEADDPGGLLVLEGTFWPMHQTEILNLLHNVEQQDKKNFPLHRIMSAAADGNAMVVAATDPHLVQRMNDALTSAYNGQADVKHDTDEYFMQVNWFRDA